LTDEEATKMAYDSEDITRQWRKEQKKSNVPKEKFFAHKFLSVCAAYDSLDHDTFMQWIEAIYKCEIEDTKNQRDPNQYDLIH
jgi:CRISPR/Cas system CSM-associated protein Csm3 (group 7 of RAMP superfamily)